MWLKKFLIIFKIIIFTNGYGRKFLKIENCSSSGETMVIEECYLKDNKFSMVLNYGTKRSAREDYVIK